MMMEDYGEAGKYFRGAYQMLEAGHQKKGIPMPELTLITYWMNMALIHWSEGDIRRGDSMLTRCMPMVNQQGDPHGPHSPEEQTGPHAYRERTLRFPFGALISNSTYRFFQLVGMLFRISDILTLWRKFFVFSYPIRLFPDHPLPLPPIF
jgi:hypothetical protein